MPVNASLVQQLRSAGLPPPSLGFDFHPYHQYRFDLAWPDDRVGVFLCGARRDESAMDVCERICEAAALGWRVLLFHSRSIADGTALEYLRRAIANLE